MALIRLEAEPEPDISPVEPEIPYKPVVFPLWSVARIDESALEALACLFDESVYDFETRYLSERSARAGRTVRS
jgi:hypothetical protein